MEEGNKEVITGERVQAEHGGPVKGWRSLSQEPGNEKGEKKPVIVETASRILALYLKNPDFRASLEDWRKQVESVETGSVLTRGGEVFALEDTLAKALGGEGSFVNGAEILIEAKTKASQESTPGSKSD